MELVWYIVHVPLPHAAPQSAMEPSGSLHMGCEYKWHVFAAARACGWELVRSDALASCRTYSNVVPAIFRATLDRSNGMVVSQSSTDGSACGFGTRVH